MFCNYRGFNVYFGQYEDVNFSSRFHMYRILTLVTWLVDVLTGDLRYRPQLTGQESGLWSHGKYSTGVCSFNNIVSFAWYKISRCVSKATCWNWSNEFSIAGFPQFWFSLGLLQSDVLGTWRSAYWLIFQKYLKINYILDNSCWIGVSSRPTIPTSVNCAWWVQVSEDNIGVHLYIEDKNSRVSICGPCRGNI